MLRYFKVSFPPMSSHLIPAPLVLVTWKIFSTFYLTMSLHLNVGSVFSKHSIFVGLLIMILRTVWLGPALKMKTADLMWVDTLKALLVEIWLERNQKVFHDKLSTWMKRFEFARLNASSWCSLSKDFRDYYSQDIVLNWPAFTASPP